MCSSAAPQARKDFIYQFITPIADHKDPNPPVFHLVVKEANHSGHVHEVKCFSSRKEACFPSCPVNGQKYCELCGKSNQDNKHGNNLVLTQTKLDTDKNKILVRVVCDFKSNGCTWRGNTNTVEEHLQNCQFQYVECPSCSKKLQKGKLDKHLSNECPMRICRCLLCDEEGTYVYITDEHPNDCPEIEMECENAGCTERFKRCDIEAHTDVCPKQEILCPFSTMGCGFVSKREDLTAHIEKGVAMHIELVASRVEAIHSVPVIKVTNYSPLSDKPMISKDFYTGHGGYRMRLILMNRDVHSKCSNDYDNNPEDGDNDGRHTVSDDDSTLRDDATIIPSSTSEETSSIANDGTISEGECYSTLNSELCSSVRNMEEDETEPHSAEEEGTDDGEGEGGRNEGGAGDGCGSKYYYMSVYLNLMPGENDDSLPFPLTGEFTITLLNQIENDNHFEATVTVTEDNDLILHRVFELNESGIGTHTFIHLFDLDYDFEDNTQYLVNGIMYFRVSFVSALQMKPWLAVK